MQVAARLLRTQVRVQVRPFTPWTPTIRTASHGSSSSSQRRGARGASETTTLNLRGERKSKCSYVGVSAVHQDAPVAAWESYRVRTVHVHVVLTILLSGGACMPAASSDQLWKPVCCCSASSRVSMLNRCSATSVRSTSASISARHVTIASASTTRRALPPRPCCNSSTAGVVSLTSSRVMRGARRSRAVLTTAAISGMGRPTTVAEASTIAARSARCCRRRRFSTRRTRCALWSITTLVRRTAASMEKSETSELTCAVPGVLATTTGAMPSLNSARPAVGEIVSFTEAPPRAMIATPRGAVASAVPLLSRTDAVRFSGTARRNLD